MADTDIDSTAKSDLTNVVVDYSVDTERTDGATGDSEVEWQMEDWEQNLGYYKSIPELQTAIDAKAVWTVGAGYEAEPAVQILLSMITGNGKDSFNDILSNAIRTYTIGGDAFIEIIRDKDDNLMNLKPLDPSSIVIVQNKKGRIKRYEQRTKHSKKGKPFRPEQILHLSRKRLADEIHGVSVIPAVEWIIKARNEAMSDWKRVLKRNLQPLIIWHLDTDDPTEIAEQKRKTDEATAEGENLYIPMGTVKPEVIQPQLNQSSSPLAWISQLNDYFFQAVNVPQIVIGNSKEFTDASGKIVYLAFEQSVKAEQLYIEEQVLAQLSIEISLTFPASLQQDLISSREADPNLQASQPNDTTAEIEGQT